MNCIIVDDEKISRMVIEKFIEKTSFLNLIGTFENAVEAVSFISNTPTDLIFLDIEMPEMTGVEMIESINNLPRIIVTSGQEKYALKAIEFGVNDYLMKPIEYPRFLKAVSRVYDIFKEEKQSFKKNDGVFLKSSSSSFVRLLFDDILWIEAMENYVAVHTSEERYMIHFTMKSIIDKLPDRLMRVHRSFIVNIDKIFMIEDSMIILKTASGKKSIPFAKTYKDDLMNRIEFISK